MHHNCFVFCCFNGPCVVSWILPDVASALRLRLKSFVMHFGGYWTVSTTDEVYCLFVITAPTHVSTYSIELWDFTCRFKINFVLPSMDARCCFVLLLFFKPDGTVFLFNLYRECFFRYPLDCKNTFKIFVPICSCLYSLYTVQSRIRGIK